MSIFRHLPGLKNLYKKIDELASLCEQHKDDYHLLINNLAAAVVIYGPLGNTILVNPYMEVLTGYDLDEINDFQGDFIDSIISEEDRDKYERARSVAFVGEDMIVRYQIKHQKGFNLWLETRFTPVLSDQGDIRQVLAVSVDLTESMNYQALIKQQNRDLEDYAYMVSHDLKAPIFTIRGMASALLADYNDKLEKEAKDYVAYIIDASDRLTSLVASVIEYSSLSIKSDVVTAVPLAEIIPQVIHDLQGQIQESQALVEFDHSLPSVQGATVRLYQVFSNLIGNAIKYRDQLRPLEIHIRRYKVTPSAITLVISDTGMGIPAAKLGDIFRPFKRAHGPSISGSGIGLSCVKKILDKIGGSVKVDSIEGKGSSFYLTLPLSPSETPADQIANL